MELTINGKEYELNFGLGFIREMDKLHEQQMQGISFGIGLEMMTAQLEMGRPTILLDIIKAGTAHLKRKPTAKEVEQYLEEKALDGELENLFKELKEATAQAPFLKQALKQTATK